MTDMVRPSTARHSLAVQVLAAGLVAGLARPPVALGASEGPSAKLLPRVVLGASGPRVAVFVAALDPKAKQHATELEQAAEGATERSERCQLVPAQDAANPTAAKARADKVQEAAEKVAQGRKNLDDLEAMKAVEDFTEAVTLLKGADSTRDMRALLDAMFLQAAAHATAGENAQAKKEIEVLVPLDPAREFTSTYFPPDLLKFAAAQQKLAENAKGELTVRTDPPGARVWVDGQFRGTSPVLVAGLSAGAHLVAAAAGGYALTQTELPPGEHLVKLEPAELAGPLKRATANVAADPEGPGRDAAAKELGRALQVDQVLLVVAKKSPAGEQLDVIALRLEVRDGHNLAFRQGVLKVGDEGAMNDFFDALYKKDDPRDGKAPRTHFKDGGGGAKTAVGAALLGVGVAAAATGAVFGVMALNQSNQFRETPQTQALKSQTLASQGRTYAWVADISYIVAGVTAITGAVLILTDKAESGEELSAAPTGKKGLDPKKVEEERRRAAEQEKRDAARRAEERRREEEARDRRRLEESQKPAEKPAEKPDEKPDDSQTKADEAAKKKADEEAAAAKAEEARQAEEARLKAEAEEAKRSKKKPSKKEQKEEEKRLKAEEEQRKREAAEAKKKEEEEARKRAEEERKQREEEAAKKKKEAEDHDDLRNY